MQKLKWYLGEIFEWGCLVAITSILIGCLYIILR